jgi:hypothetical protein
MEVSIEEIVELVLERLAFRSSYSVLTSVLSASSFPFWKV